MKRKREHEAIYPAPKRIPALELALANQRAEFLERELQPVKEKSELAVGLQRAETEKLELRLKLERMERAGVIRRSTPKGNPAQRPKIVSKLSWLRPTRVNLPSVLLNLICTYLNDADLWRLRGTSLLYYAAFFHQRVAAEMNFCIPEYKVKFNDVRSLRLARMGRVFPRVEILKDHNDAQFNEQDLMAINRVNFPALRALDLATEDGKSKSLKYLPGHPKLEFLCVNIRGGEWQYINDEKFPNLRKLTLYLVNEEQIQDLEAGSHGKIDEILVVDSLLDEGGFNWDLVSKSEFPKLESVASCSTIPESHSVRLTESGVKVMKIE